MIAVSGREMQEAFPECSPKLQVDFHKAIIQAEDTQILKNAVLILMYWKTCTLIMWGHEKNIW